MKTIKLFLTTIAMLLCSVMANAYDFEVDGMYYNLHSATDLTVEVTYGENRYSGEVIIPSTITYQSRNLAVVGISSWAFGNDSELISITIPKSVVFIYHNSFKDCNSLKHLYIENGEEDILVKGVERQSPFCDCPLESIYIGRDFTYQTTTHDPLFYQQTQLKSLTIGNDFWKIENDMFNDCTSLEEVYIEDGKYSLSLGYNDGYEGTGVFSDCPIKHLYLGRDLFYTADGYTKFLGSYNSPLRSLTIGKFVDEIENYTFCECESIQNLRINDCNKTLKVSKFSFSYNDDNGSIDLYLGRNLDYSGGVSPFSHTGVASLVIGDSVTNINDDMFHNCFSLENVTIGNNVVRIGNSAFCQCRGLYDIGITIPNSVTYIGESAFKDSRLGSITLPNGLTSIENSTFSGCNLTSITIPNGVTSIGDYAFLGCYLKSITIPNGVTNIGRSAFAGCDFTTIIIPNSVCNIGEGTFNNCDSLRSIYVEKATPITLNKDILLASAYINTTLYVPAGSLAAYQSADIWKNFWNIQEYYLDKKFSVNYFIDGELYAVDSVKHGDTIIPRAEPIKEGYTFSGWSEVPEIMPAHDVEIYGSFIFSSVTDVKTDPKQSQKVLENNQLIIIRPNGKKYNTLGQEL